MHLELHFQIVLWGFGVQVDIADYDKIADETNVFWPSGFSSDFVAIEFNVQTRDGHLFMKLVSVHVLEVILHLWTQRKGTNFSSKNKLKKLSFEMDI